MKNEHEIAASLSGYQEMVLRGRVDAEICSRSRAAERLYQLGLLMYGTTIRTAMGDRVVAALIDRQNADARRCEQAGVQGVSSQADATCGRTKGDSREFNVSEKKVVDKQTDNKIKE